MMFETETALFTDNVVISRNYEKLLLKTTFSDENEVMMNS